MKIKRGEVWLVNLDPAIGAEIRKTRPVVVVSSDAIGVLPIKLIAPITEWKEHLRRNIWHIRIDPDKTNGLAKVSAIDTLQLRGIDNRRFLQRLGVLSSSTMLEVAASIASVVEYDPAAKGGD